MNSEKISVIKGISAIIAALIFGWIVIFIMIPWIQQRQETRIKEIAKETPLPRFTQTDFRTRYNDTISELTDTKNNVTYLIFNGKVLLSKEPTSATKAILEDPK